MKIQGRRYKLTLFGKILFTVIIFSLCFVICELSEYEESLNNEQEIIYQYRYIPPQVNMVGYEPLNIDIYSRCERDYGIDRYLLMAIEIEETGWYQSPLYLNKHNTWGAYRNGEWLSFKNDEESTIELARVLKEYYFDEGLDTVEEISKKFCPPTSDEWAEHITKIYDQIKNDEKGE